jgi:hypothetical protein
MHYTETHDLSHLDSNFWKTMQSILIIFVENNIIQLHIGQQVIFWRKLLIEIKRHTSDRVHNTRTQTTCARF